MSADSDPAQRDIQKAEMIRIHKEKFYEALDAIKCEEELQNTDNKNISKKNMRLKKQNEYTDFVNEIEGIPKKKVKTTHDYHILKHYEVITIGDSKRIIKKRTDDHPETKYLVPYEEAFDALYRCHERIGHKSRDLMKAEVGKMHLNLTIEHINCKYYILHNYVNYYQIINKL